MGIYSKIPELVLGAKSDVHQSGDQQAVGLMPARSGDIFWWRLILKHFLHLAVPRRAVVSFWR